MIRIGIVEDEETHRKQITEYLKEYQKTCEERLEITVYRDGDGIISEYKAQFDIIFMDILMNFMDGMTAAEQIRKMDSEVVIIFLTNIAQYAIKAYEVDALDYILKPVTYFVFSQKLARAIAKIKKRDKTYIVVQIKEGVVRLDVSDIQYVESFGHNMILHTNKQDYISTMTMKSIEQELENKGFSRGNSCYLINLSYVEGIEDKCAVLKNKKLKISRPRMKAFMKDLTKYWGEER